MNTLHCCLQLRERIKLVSEKLGYTRAIIYAWWKNISWEVLLPPLSPINPKTNTPVTELEQLHARMQGMQLEIDLLKETASVFKNAPASTRPP